MFQNVLRSKPLAVCILYPGCLFKTVWWTDLESPHNKGQAYSLPIIKDSGFLNSGCFSCNTMQVASSGPLKIRDWGQCHNDDILSTALMWVVSTSCLWHKCSFLLPASMKLWQSHLLACHEGRPPVLCVLRCTLARREESRWEKGGVKQCGGFRWNPCLPTSNGGTWVYPIRGESWSFVYPLPVSDWLWATLGWQREGHPTQIPPCKEAPNTQRLSSSRASWSLDWPEPLQFVKGIPGAPAASATLTLMKCLQYGSRCSKEGSNQGCTMKRSNSGLGWWPETRPSQGEAVA